jgi:hypothetical protein
VSVTERCFESRRRHAVCSGAKSFGVDGRRHATLLADCPQPFERSQLYSTVTESKFIDESLRCSEFRAIKQHSALFDACDKLLAEVTAGDPLNDFYLLRSDVTHIVYKVRPSRSDRQ